MALVMVAKWPGSGKSKTRLSAQLVDAGSCEDEDEAIQEDESSAASPRRGVVLSAVIGLVIGLAFFLTRSTAYK